jgi:vacuolar-type H+-ATPase subunit F/Vma7
MTKKDYELIAEVLKQAVEADKENRPVAIIYICQVMAHRLKEQNTRFDGLAFSRACGYDFNITL